MPFVNSYTFAQGGSFRKVIALADGALAIGSDGTEALAVRTHADGTIAWARKFGPPPSPPFPSFRGQLGFVDAVAADAGGFAIIGNFGLLDFAAGGAIGAAQILVRIDGQGNALWARLFVAGTNTGRIVRGPSSPEEFLVYARVEQTAQTYKYGVADLMRFDAGGTLLNSARLIADANGGRVFDAIALGTGYLLVGDLGTTLTQAQWVQGDPVQDFESLGVRGLVLLMDKSLGSCTGYALSNAKSPSAPVSLRAMCAIESGTVLIAGATADPAGPTQALVLTLSGSTADAINGYAMPLDDPATRPLRIAPLDPALPGTTNLIAAPRGNALLLIGHLPDGSASRSRLLNLGTGLAVAAEAVFNFDSGATVLDLAAASGAALVCGQTAAPPLGVGFLLSPDDSLSCCRTHKSGELAKTSIVFQRGSASCALTVTSTAASGGNLTASEAACSVASACVGTTVDVGDTTLLQSPYLNLQAAGSDGTDASKGILLRWFLAGALANHLPKGDLAHGTANFNKPGDFITLYRAPYPTGVATRKLDFASDLPVHVDDAARTLYFQTGSVLPKDLFAVSFSDAAAYAAAKQSANPATNPAGFLAAYGAKPFEVELRGTVALACDVEFQADTGGSVQIETRSVGDSGILAEKHVTLRRTLYAADAPTTRLFAENMRSVCLRGLSSQIKSVAFLRYQDVIGDVNARKAWSEIGQFALSLDQSQVFTRLEDPPRFTVDSLWRKFDAAARVKVANYKTRWTDPAQGLAAAVQTYIQLSDSDPTATATLMGANLEDGAISASYLDLLQIAAGADYHVARMLGLGFVDGAAQGTAAYIHLIAYRTLGDVGDGLGARDVHHLYMSLPTTLSQSRLPLTPDLDGIEYGLSVPTGSGVPYALTDAQGYTPDGIARYIRLYPGCRPLYVPDGDFFDPPDPIDYSAMSLPVLYGVEYRRQSDSAWKRPTIAHDSSFTDTASPPVPEVLTTPFPATQRASAFIHKETDPGIHIYSVYGVNLFSRASPPGPPRATDATVFTPRNTLLPPSDLQVQYIQPEAPLMLTTSHEQWLLTQIAQADKTLVRFCCNYGMAQETAYGFADTIQLFHRQQLPANVTGCVTAISSVSDPALLRIGTGPFQFDSTGDTVVPTLAQGLKDHFVGGVLVAGGTRLTVQDIQWPGTNGDNPIFLVTKPTMTGVTNDSGGNTVSVQDAPLAIGPGDLVMAVENMAAAVSWGSGNPLAVTLQIGGTDWTHCTESFTRPDGTSVTRSLRGIWGTATVAAVSSGDPLKLYDIVFDTCVLHAHAQSSDPLNPVDWWKGTVRLPVTGHDPEDRRTLKVVQIVSNFADPLVLRAVDDSGEADDVVTSGHPLVNYYPGYIVYLHADGGNDFDAANLLPAPGEGSRTSLIGARTRDSTTHDGSGAAYCSALSVPQLIAPLEIREPKRPRQPHGLAYATPPDAYSKSSYTVNVEFDQTPFAVVFYRADALNLLASIYSDASVAAIRATIFAAGGDPFVANRFEDLFAYLDDSRAAPDPIPNVGDFAMPIPDLLDLNLPGGPLSSDDKAKAKATLFNAFVPMSEQPLIYDFISTDPAFVPSNRPQTFRDAAGNVLAPGEPGFDLSPMAMRPGGNAVRFVDFTLDGSMNPNTLYFYCAREIGNRMQIGEASLVFGPVKLVNLAPPPAPRLRKLTAVPADAASGTGPRIAFEVIAPAAIDPIFALRLYRTSSAVDALSVRSMSALPDIELSTLAPSSGGIVTVVDDFSEDGFVPFGDPLFYRLAWIRKVTWEDANHVGQSALAISEPTRTYLANVIDVVNPIAPTPALSLLSTASNGDKLLRVTWPKVVHNATYCLSRLGGSGSWMRVGTLKSNAATLTFDLADALPPANEDGDPIYYRFKIEVENSSGLLNVSSEPVTVRLDQLN